MTKQEWIVVGITAALLLLVLPISRWSNCGGNTVAVAYTSQVAMCMKMAINERQTDAPATFDSLIPPSSWPEVFQFGCGVKSYWVLKNITPLESGPVIICAQFFDNVPQPTIWNLYRRNSAFAAGFLREHARLLDETEYNSLDFNKYFLVTKEDVSSQQLEGIGTNAPSLQL